MIAAEFIGKINEFILNPIITLMFAVALLVFFVGIFQFISADAEKGDKGKAKDKILYGLIGMFIMFSAYGIIRLILSTIGVDHPGYPFN